MKVLRADAAGERAEAPEASADAAEANTQTAEQRANWAEHNAEATETRANREEDSAETAEASADGQERYAEAVFKITNAEWKRNLTFGIPNLFTYWTAKLKRFVIARDRLRLQ